MVFDNKSANPNNNKDLFEWFIRQTTFLMNHLLHADFFTGRH